MAERLAEALDLVLAAFGERQPEPAVPRSGPLELDGERLGGAVVEGDATPPPVEIGPRHAPLHESLVDSRQRVSRMKEPVSQRAVVGQQKRAFDVPVEPPDGIQTHVSLHEVGDDRAPLGITQRGHVAAWLVQQDVAFRLGRR